MPGRSALAQSRALFEALLGDAILALSFRESTKMQVESRLFDVSLEPPSFPRPWRYLRVI
eukprot:4789753-Pyramimonas_sp.AAC.2